MLVEAVANAVWENPWLLLIVWFAFNVSQYQKEQARQEEKRRAAAKTPTKTFTLETSKNSGWEYKNGFGNKFEYLGGGKGRSWWLAGEKDVAEDFGFDREKNPNTSDKVYRKMMMEKNPIETADMSKLNESASDADQAATAAIRGSVFYSRLQTDEGFWPGDYGGPLFLLPGLVIACYTTNVDLGHARRSAMLRYIMNHQHSEDGGWGMHIEGPATVFGSALNYTAARLLGLEKTDPRAVRAREYLKSMGGAVAAPQWAKFWLATLGAYDWKGVNPTPPELWLLPYWFPFHPGRMWCHCRMVYLPMSALFGSRYVYPKAESDELILSLREELYVTKYEKINWGAFSVRECIAEIDKYNPQSMLMTVANHVLHNTIENPIVRALFHYPLSLMRKRALDFAFNYVHAEDKHTNWIDIGPVSKAFHIVATFARFGADSPYFQRHIARIDDYLWIAEDGMKMQGYNGSMFWDTCFAMHAVANAVVASKLQKDKSNIIDKDRERIYKTLVKTSKFVDDMQVREDVEEKEIYFRDNSLGGWPFSTSDHGWPISDCTAEGIKASILLSTFPDFQNDANLYHIPQERIEQAVKIILDLQNTSTDYGWASYELNRGYNWYELLNPAQVFGDIMIDYSYVECSSAAVQALCEFAVRYPKSQYAKTALVAAKKGADFIVSKQRTNGGWYGSWAVCFTYAAWFGVEGLAVTLHTCDSMISQADKESYESTMRKGCRFLLERQRGDGGWGESVRSCAEQEWVESEAGSQVVQTGWAVLAFVRVLELLHETGRSSSEEYKELFTATTNACKFLRSRQLENGDWDQEMVSGVFNKSCAITYTAYRNVFPIWALARYSIFVNSH